MAKDLPLEFFAGVRTLLGTFIAIVFIAATKFFLEIRLERLLIGTLPQSAATVLMFFTVSLCRDYTSGLSFLITGVVVGAISYSATMACMLFIFKNINDDFNYIFEKSLWVFKRGR